MSTTQAQIADLNKRSYANGRVVNWYSELEFLHPSEAVILRDLLPQIRNKRLLDIGIGGGRTTKYLLEISSDYTGIDYTPACIEAAKKKYPAANLLNCDARDLGRFSAGDFSFVLFSLNGIDYVCHEDRLQILGEIHRVLQPGGYFAFSTHNRDYRDFNKLPWQAGVPVSVNLLKNCVYTLAFLPRHLLMRKHEVHADDYSIINDNAHGFSLLTYNIGVAGQNKQLESSGFIAVAAYDMHGKLVTEDRDSAWTYYLAQKPL